MHWTKIYKNLDLLPGYFGRQLRKDNTVMLHFGRCGSSVVAGMLEQNPNICWDGELLHRYKHKSIPEHLISSDAKSAMHLRQYKYGSKHWGVEIKPLPFMHLSPAQLNMSTGELFDFLQRLGFNHYIFLERPNFLRKLISTTVAVQRNAYQVKKDKSKLYLNINQTVYGPTLIDLFDKLDQATKAVMQEAQKHGVQLLRLNYGEHILRDPTIAYKLICHQLSIDSLGSPRPKLKKVNPGSLPELLSNYEEIEDCLSNTKYDWMLSGQENQQLR